MVFIVCEDNEKKRFSAFDATHGVTVRVFSTKKDATKWVDKNNKKQKNNFRR